ncbi:MAG: hypothetical protein AAFZ58_06915 [Pseudomonadota bacterium]
MKPFSFIYVFVFLFALAGYPIALLFDQDGMLFYFVRHLDQRYLGVAYVWTVLSAALLLALNVLFGSHRNFDKFMEKPRTAGRVDPDALWWVVFVVGCGLNALFFVLAGFELPLLNLPENVTELLLRRIELKEQLNPILFNLGATVLGPLALILSFFFVKHRRGLKIAASIASFVVLGTFSLAKSSFIVGVLILIFAYSFLRPLSIRSIMKVSGVFLIALLPMFILTNSKEAPHVRGEALAEIVMARIVYGQWAALPFFFEMFERDEQDVGLLTPPYLSDGDAWTRGGEEVPPRKVMRAVTGYRVLEGTGSGVAVTYFIGEAFAVAGESGIVLACVLVCGLIWMLTFVFKDVQKTPLTIYAYSWFLYKIGMGLITGFSAFVASSLTIAVVGLFLLTVARAMAQPVLADLSKRSGPSVDGMGMATS